MGIKHRTLPPRHPRPLRSRKSATNTQIEGEQRPAGQGNQLFSPGPRPRHRLGLRESTAPARRPRIVVRQAHQGARSGKHHRRRPQRLQILLLQQVKSQRSWMGNGHSRRRQTVARLSVFRLRSRWHSTDPAVNRLADRRRMSANNKEVDNSLLLVT